MPRDRHRQQHSNQRRVRGFDVLSAEVSFYDVANPGTILNSYALDPNVIVNGINIAGGHLAGIDTGFFDSFVSELANRREWPVCDSA